MTTYEAETHIDMAIYQNKVPLVFSIIPHFEEHPNICVQQIRLNPGLAESYPRAVAMSTCQAEVY
jgi:hypothetical protein